MMLSGIFNKRKKIQELRSPALQDIKKYAHAFFFGFSIYKAISCQKELHSVDFRQEDITDPQLIALAETLVEMPMISSLDLRDNRITDDGAKALLEVLRLQIIVAKTPLKTDPKTKLPIFPVLPEYARYITHVNIKGNEISALVLQELAQYIEILKREDKRIEIRAALAQIDRNSVGRIDDDEFKAVLKLLTGTEPNKKEVKLLVQQHAQSIDSTQSAISLENLLLAKCSSSSSPSKKAACPPWEALVQVRHATLGPQYPSQLANSNAKSHESAQVTTMARVSEQSLAPLVHQGPPTPCDEPSIQPSISLQSTQRISVTTSSASSASSKQLVMSIPPPSRPQPPPPPSQTTVSYQQQQSPISSSSSEHESSTSTAKLKADFKPSAPPPPPLPMAQTQSSPDSRASYSSRYQSSSSMRDVSEFAVPESPREVAHVPSSPSIESTATYAKGSVSPDRSSVHSSASSLSKAAFTDPVDSPRQQQHVPAPPVASIIKQRHADDESDSKKRATSAMTPIAIIADSPRWRNDDVLTDDEGSFASQEDSGGDTRVGGNDSDNEHDGYSRNTTSSNRSNASSQSSRGNKNQHPGHQRMDSGTFASEIVELPDGEGDGLKVLQTAYDAHDRSCAASLEDDLSSLVYHASERSGGDDGGDRSFSLSVSLGEEVAVPQEPQPETNDDASDDDRVESIVVDMMKDNKPRSVAKLIHSELKRGMVVTDFPNEIPFRNLVALILSENSLSNLALFKECRFPCALVLDLSKNKLVKLVDDDFAGFPRLQVLNLANNRLRSIQGLGKLFALKALSVDNNAMKSVKNIEHLVQLQVLTISGNFVGNIAALRLLSLNKMLTHLNLDGNPIVATNDERQKRKNIVHLLNLIPTLLSLGSIPCASLHTKEKKKTLSNTGASAPLVHGKSLFDEDMLPGASALWITKACELLHIFQDVEVQTRRNNSSYHDDDGEWGSNSNDDEEHDRPRKPLNREQQRQKDELRSRAIGHRSREKAMPSPPKVKTSVYAFGPPLPPAPPKKPVKKAPPADRAIVQQQQRRASELSAPKYQPVDKTLFHQEQKRKSRPTFDLNMSVAERLLLAQEKTQRRTSAAVHKSTRTKSITQTKPRSASQIDGKPLDVDLSASLTSTSPRRSPSKLHQDVVAFRIEPLRNNESPVKSSSIEKSNQHTSKLESSCEERQSSRQDSPPKQVADSPKKIAVVSSPMKTAPVISSSNEKHFLHDLAVTEFLNHAEEEFSTALTALNVLLTMSEKVLGDKKKLLEYRSSLEALDILDEHESHALYGKIRDYNRDHSKQAECAQAFERLGRVKKALGQLLQKLEVHTPGSSVICDFCRVLRTADLRDILPRKDDDDEGHRSDGAAKEDEQHSTTNDTIKCEAATSEAAHHAGSEVGANVLSPSITSRLFVSISESAREVTEKTPTSTPEIELETTRDETVEVKPSTVEPDLDHFAAGADDELDFLSSDKSMFDDDTSALANTTTTSETSALDFLDVDEVKSVSHSPVPAPAYSPKVDTYAVETDITEDIQSRNDDELIFLTTDEAAETSPVLNDDAGLLQEDASVNELSNSDLVQEQHVTNDDDDWLQTTEDTPIDSDPEDTGDEVIFGSDVDITGDDIGLRDPEESAAAEPDDSETVFDHDADVDPFLETEDVHADEDTSLAAPGEPDDETELIEGTQQIDSTGEGVANEELTAKEDGDDYALENEAKEEQVLSDAGDADDEEAETFGDWEKGFDPNTNHYFWFNHETGESAWTPPEGWPYEVDTPFEADGEYSVEGEEAEGEYAAEDGEAPVEYDETSEANEHEQMDGDCEGEHSAIESSQHSSEFDDDLFSDQDLPSF